MNEFARYMEFGISAEGQRKIALIVGVIMASAIDTNTKRELIGFMRELEEFIENEDEF